MSQKQVMPKSEDLSRSLEINAIWTFDTEFPTIFNKSCTYITFKSAVKHRQLGIIINYCTCMKPYLWRVSRAGRERLPFSSTWFHPPIIEQFVHFRRVHFTVCVQLVKLILIIVIWNYEIE